MTDLLEQCNLHTFLVVLLLLRIQYLELVAGRSL
jgi:hypothetical protein